ncbi:hypothetical protein [Streptococcus uberis]|uniref:hypothetical protein n=1 Tax=Streptococcus uberis TaxID=1349 RepID=UPI001FF13D48|nr:hypothetical protein [Streptococcus uberis]MCK1222236.1 hypothetical protein [Streptococcus uberis]
MDLQLGREERVEYDPIDRIFDIYNTIVIQKMMTLEEYKLASGAGNTIGLKKAIRQAELIVKFIDIVSPGSNPVDKFFLARELKLDGPIEEIEPTLNKLKDDKDSVTTNVLTTLAVQVATSEIGDRARTLKIRSIKNNILNNPEIKKHYLQATDSHVDDIFEFFQENPIETTPDLKENLTKNPNVFESANSLIRTTNRLITKGERASERRQSLVMLIEMRDNLSDLTKEELKKLHEDEFIEAKEVLMKIRDLAFKLSK